MKQLYPSSFDALKQQRVEKARVQTEALLESAALDDRVRKALEEWQQVAGDIDALRTEVSDLHILYSTVVEHATQAEADLMRRNEEVGQFLSGMSHEFRTPLNAIIGYSEMVLEIAAEEGITTLKDEVERIAGAGRHMLSLTNDVLDISKVEAGRLELSPEPVLVEELVEGVVSTMEALARRRGNTLTFRVDPAIGAMNVDPMRLRQCLTNLIGNACKFTEEGSISVAVDRGEEWVSCAVSDTGIGITNDQQARLFQAFVQASASTARDFGGSGLGLALSQQLAEAMGGRIEVVSVRGEGSTFTMLIPASLIVSSLD